MKNKLNTTNKIPYKKDIVLQGMKLSIMIENPNGLNKQKVSIISYKKEDGVCELTKNNLEFIKYYLETEGYMEEARQHNLYGE
jgi:hypothetical protein